MYQLHCVHIMLYYSMFRIKKSRRTGMDFAHPQKLPLSGVSTMTPSSHPTSYRHSGQCFIAHFIASTLSGRPSKSSTPPASQTRQAASPLVITFATFGASCRPRSEAISSIARWRYSRCSWAVSMCEGYIFPRFCTSDLDITRWPTSFGSSAMQKGRSIAVSTVRWMCIFLYSDKDWNTVFGDTRSASNSA